jgi:hypothetical protein
MRFRKQLKGAALTDRNEPSSAESTEKLVADRVRAALAEGGGQESLQIEWRESPKSLPVISMPLGLLLYNPDTHRIKAQRDFDANGDTAIQNRPWGPEAQKYLDFLLSALPNDPSKMDPAFDKLREDLESYGQKEPGIITPSGILVNGNSRCAALRRGSTQQMRVAVLPPDWGWLDVATVERELQMRKDFRREYSFVNTLIALDEAIRDVGAEAAIKSFRMTKTGFNRSVWVLQTLRDLVDRSVSGEGSFLNLREFENDQGKLEELYRSYGATSKVDPVAAEIMKESRLLTLLLDKSKTDIRFVTERFIPDHLEKNLKSIGMSEVSSSQTVVVPGLDRELPAEPAGVQQAKGLVDAVAKLKAQMNSTDEKTRRDSLAKITAFDRIVETALDAAGKSARLKKTQQAAIEQVNDAADSLEGAVLAVADARSKQALDEVGLEEAIANLRGSLAIFASSLSKLVTFSEPTAAWLDAVKLLKDD